MTHLVLLFYLLAGHALADYPLQGDYLAKSKNHRLAGDSAGWQLHLFYHALIQGAMVMWLTRSPFLGLAEALVHGVTDWAKCDGRISGRFDQGVHIASKVLWMLAAPALTAAGM